MSSDKSARDALEFCTVWASSLILYKQGSTDPNMLDCEHITGYRLWEWEKSTVRGMWSKNIMPIAKSIAARASDKSPSFYDNRKSIVYFCHGLGQACQVGSIGFDYYKQSGPVNASSKD